MKRSWNVGGRETRTARGLSNNANSGRFRERVTSILRRILAFDDTWREQANSHPIRPGQNYQRNSLVSSTTRRQGRRGCRPFPLHPQSPPALLRFASDHLSRTISLDEAEHFLHNHHASVASLRLLFAFTPERRSVCLRNRCSPSPEYPRSRELRCRNVMIVANH